MKYAEFMRCAGVILAMFCAVALSAQAGGGPQNVLVVVNDNSLESLELGHYYQFKRGIPARNICHIAATTNYSIDTASYSNQIRAPVLSYIASAGLSNQIDIILFSKDIPYRVYEGAYTNYRHSSLPSSIFYGFRSSPDAYTIGCNLATGSGSDYYSSERSFSRSASPSSNRYYLSGVLAATNLAVAKTLIDRSIQADNSLPTGTVYYLHTLDDRNFQWPLFENSTFMARFLSISQQQSLLDGYSYENSSKTDVVGYMVGQCCGLNPGTQTYWPGALAEHVTSYGGVLYNESEFQQPNREQDRVTRWLEAGCAGTYGTIAEPCEYPQKFPVAHMHYWYGRGFSLGESVYMAVQSPYQGVLAGDPMCAPYATPCTVSISGVTNSQVIVGTTNLSVTGLAVSVTRPLNQIDLLLDGKWLTTLTNVAPVRSNIVTATINGTNCTYVVPSSVRMFNVATGLAAVINSSNLGCTAQVSGDRIEIKQNTIGQPGAALTCVVNSSTGSAASLTTYAWSPFTNFLETTFRAHKQITLSGIPTSGDVVRVIVTNLAGSVCTNQVVAGTNDTALGLLTNLTAVVNADTNLQNSFGYEAKWVWTPASAASEVYFVARTNTWEGCTLFIVYSISNQPGSTLIGPGFSDNFNDNSNVLAARATIFLSEGRTNLVGTYSLITTNLSDGPHELTVVAYEGTAVRTQGRATIPFVVDNNLVECTITNPPTGGTALLSESVTAYIQASSVTSVEFYVEGKRLATTNSALYVFSFAATNYGVGTVNIHAKAFASGGVSALSSDVLVTIVPDYDFDGLDDNWEIQNWGSITVTAGTNDWDNDGVNNHDEYIADTQPTNDASFFRFSQIQWINGVAQLEYVSSTARQYRLHYNDDSLVDGMWLDSSNWLQGGSGVTTQFDDGTVMPLPTSASRFYRVRAHRP